MSNIIDSIQLSGVTYSIQGSGGGNPTVELTQAEYDALVESGAVQTNTYYIITDAQAGDLTQYWTSAQTQSAITSAVSTKQDQLVSGTNIKTINNESILGSGNIDIQGGGITSGEVQTMINDSVPQERLNLIYGLAKTGGGLDVFIWSSGSTGTSSKNVYFAKINEKSIIGNNSFPTNDLSLVETSAITSSVTSSSTDDEIPTAKAVYDKLSEKADTSAVTESINAAVSGKADTSAVTAIQDSLSGYVTTDTLQDITAQKTFVGDHNNSKKSIKFKQYNNASKVGFVVVNSASTNNELATFELRPDTYTDSSSVSHPLLYLGHYRNNGVATAGVPQTMVGFRQYDQSGAAAYHYLIPLPAEAKTPFSLTTSFKDYFAPLGFKVDSGGTMVTTDNTGVVDLSSYLGGGISSGEVQTMIDESISGKVDTSAVTSSVTSSSTDIITSGGVYAQLGGLKLVKLTQQEYDALSPTYDSNTLYVIVN